MKGKIYWAIENEKGELLGESGLGGPILLTDDLLEQVLKNRYVYTGEKPVRMELRKIEDKGGR